MRGKPFSAKERDKIRAKIERAKPLSKVARQLGRATSSVCREVARNGGHDRYQATTAERCRARLKQTRFQTDLLFARRVEKRPATKDSPMTIAPALGSEGSPVSEETICRAICVTSAGGFERSSMCT
ncbi:MAG: hypothetical protein M0008_00540 [Actinomycetota bacterium]|jgi:IS30 family transposase|nr:hypothetical protein [Actinomycetota bacterium]